MIPFERRHRFLGNTGATQTPTWDEWLTMRAADLYERARVKSARGLREAAIGHAYPMQEHWLPTVGMWGVCAKGEIMDVLPSGFTDGAFRAFKHKWHLRTLEFDDDMDASKMCFTVQKALMRGVVQEKYEVDWRAVGREVGILPVEAVLYDHSFQLLCIVSDKTPRKLLKLNDEARRELWDLADIDVSYPMKND